MYFKITPLHKRYIIKPGQKKKVKGPFWDLLYIYQTNKDYHIKWKYFVPCTSIYNFGKKDIHSLKPFGYNIQLKNQKFAQLRFSVYFFFDHPISTPVFCHVLFMTSKSLKQNLSSIYPSEGSVCNLPSVLCFTICSALSRTSKLHKKTNG